MTIISILVILTAGWGAGVVTGLVGASAAVIVTPMLVTFLGYPAYTAIGISLATDVFASAASARTYYKHGMHCFLWFSRSLYTLWFPN